jgi:hypothetical protein
MARVHEFEAHGAPVAGFAASRRDKGFLTWDAAGTASLRYGTTGVTFFTLKAADAKAFAIAPKSNGLFAMSAAGKLWPGTCTTRIRRSR